MLGPVTFSSRKCGNRPCDCNVYHLFDRVRGLVAELLKPTFERLLVHLDTALSGATTAEESTVSLARPSRAGFCSSRRSPVHVPGDGARASW